MTLATTEQATATDKALAIKTKLRETLTTCIKDLESTLLNNRSLVAYSRTRAWRIEDYVDSNHPYISLVTKQLGEWEDDEEKDEDDYEDNDFMVMTRDSIKEINTLIETFSLKYPALNIDWEAGEKCYAEFDVREKR